MPAFLLNFKNEVKSSSNLHLREDTTDPEQALKPKASYSRKRRRNELTIRNEQPLKKRRIE